VIWPPSVTVFVAARLTVVTSVSSSTEVVAAAVLRTRLSNVVPPETAVIVRLVVPASRYGSSLGALTATVPLVAPLAMVIVSPVESVTVTADVAVLVSVAV